MATQTVYGNTEDGGLDSTSMAGPAYQAYTGSTIIGVAHSYAGDPFPVYTGGQAALSFTNFVPTNNAVSAVTLSMYCYTYMNTDDFTVYVRDFDWGATLEVGDWHQNLSAYTLLAYKAMSAHSNGVYVAYSSTGSFAGAISKSSTNKWMMIMDALETSTMPSYDNIAGYRASDMSGTTYDPKLVITYAPDLSISFAGAYYPSYSRTGPNNTPWGFTLTAGASTSQYQLRTASGGGGTLVSSGSAVSGLNIKTAAYNAAGLVEGPQTLYVRAGDGTNWGSDYAFTLLRDDSVNAPSGISHSPGPVGPVRQYSVTFNGADTYSTNGYEMQYEIRTASGGGGTLVGSGSFTQGASVTTSTHTDSGLVNGANTRWLRIQDGANNVAETSFTVTASFGGGVMKRRGGIPGMRPGKAPGNPVVW